MSLPEPAPTAGNPLLFIAAGTAIVLNTFVADPSNALSGSVIILLGIPVYFLWKRRHDTKVE